MLLRSSSTPIMNSWVPSSSSDNNYIKNDQFTTISVTTNCNLPRTRSLSMITTTTASLSTTSSSSDQWNFPRPQTSTHPIIPSAATSAARVNKCQSTTFCHLPLPYHPPRTTSHRNTNSPANKNETIKTSNHHHHHQRLISNSGLGGVSLASPVGDARMMLPGEDGAVVCAVAEGGGSDRGNNNRISGAGWGRSSDGQDGWSNYSDGKSGGNNNGGHETAEAYYQRMIDANPSNALLLSNYAKFLKEVKGDVAKAEEYCERAILVNPGDGNVLSLYADIIWETKKDVNRAETYFDQAVQSSPDDCYVLASYAKFLWDAEEEEDEEEQQSSWTTAGGGAFQDHHFPSPISATS